MQPTSEIRFEHDQIDAPGLAADDDTDASVHFDAASGKVTFAAEVADDMSPVRRSVVLSIDTDTMARYAELDTVARSRVHAMLHDAAHRMIDGLPDEPTLVIELTGAMLDAACRVQ